MNSLRLHITVNYGDYAHLEVGKRLRCNPRVFNQSAGPIHYVSSINMVSLLSLQKFQLQQSVGD